MQELKKHEKLSPWDVVYAVDMTITSPVTVSRRCRVE
jgi:hypothetical protein